MVRDGDRHIPTPPDGMLPETLIRWPIYWASDVARATCEAHIPIVERLFIRYDERARAYATVRKQGRVTQGSQGQLVAHPLLKYIDACDAEIRQMEDRLGLSPRGMAQLGANFAHAQKTLDDLNQTMEAPDNTEDNDADPRIQVVG